MKIVLLILCLGLGPAARAASYYVSNTGNDANAGTSAAAPWQHLATLGARALAAGDVIALDRASTFREPLPVPSGGVTYTAYGTGSGPLITGLQPLTAWTSLGGNLWEAPLNSGAALNVVTIGGRVVPRGRYPNFNATDGGFLTINSHTYTDNGNGTSSGTVTTGSLTGAWVGAEIVMRSVEWVLDRNLVTAQSGNTLSYTNPHDRHEPGDGHGFFFQNSPATLDAQNEWYYDPSAFKLKLYSTTNPAALNVKASVIERLVDSEYKDNLTLSDLRFEGADEYAIRVRQTTGTHVLNCRIDATGVDGIKADQWTRSSITNTTIYQTNNCGIDMSYSGRMNVSSNTLIKCGILPGMGQSNNQQMDGIKYENAGVATRINNNRIDSIGYCGIQFHGDSTIVRNNFISNFMLIVADGGGIYTNGDNPALYRWVEDNTVLYGYGGYFGFHTSPGGAIGIYCDDTSRKVYIRRNTVAFCSRAGLYFHNNQDVVATDNTVYGNETGALWVHDRLGLGFPTRNMTFDRNIVFAAAGKYALVNEGMSDDFSQRFVSLQSNAYAQPGSGNLIQTVWGDYVGNVPATYHDYTLASWRAAFPAYDASSTFTQAPTDPSQTRLEYNPTGVPVSRALPGVYRDVRNGTYAGTITLPAYASAVLMYASPLAALGARGLTALNVYPNPVTGRTLTVVLQAATKQTAEVALVNTLGQRVRTNPQALTAGPNQFLVATDGLAPGLYQLVVSVNQHAIASHRVVVTN